MIKIINIYEYFYAKIELHQIKVRYSLFKNRLSKFNFMFITILVSILSVVNPLGAVPVFLSLTPSHTRKERTKTSLQTSAYFFLILGSFFLAGSFILSFFGISIFALRIAGGLVILLSGFDLLSGKFEKSRVTEKIKNEAIEKDDISFAPMAMPMLSGPGSISLLIGYYSQYPEWTEKLIIVGAIATAALVVYLILNSAQMLNRILGRAGLKAISRIMGFIVMAIGIQYIIVGIVGLVSSQPLEG